jgi:hypothetical protein
MTIAATRRVLPTVMERVAHRSIARMTLPIISLLMFGSLVIPTGLLAIALGLGLLRLPPELFAVLRRLPIAFPLHMIASGAALILIPIAAFARRRTALHRSIGRSAAIAVAVGGLTALPVALASGGPILARAGFFTQAVVWLALLVAAVVAIRNGRPSRHAFCMIAMAAVATGAIWLRLAMAAVNAIELPFAPAYVIASWTCWLLPLGVTAVVAGRRLGIRVTF